MYLHRTPDCPLASLLERTSLQLTVLPPEKAVNMGGLLNLHPSPHHHNKRDFVENVDRLFGVGRLSLLGGEQLQTLGESRLLMPMLPLFLSATISDAYVATISDAYVATISICHCHHLINIPEGFRVAQRAQDCPDALKWPRGSQIARR